MKKIILILAVSVIAFVSCSKEDNPVEDPKTQVSIKGKISKWVSIGEEEEETYTFVYGDNGFVKEVVYQSKEKPNVDNGNKEKVENRKFSFAYNEKNYVEKMKASINNVPTYVGTFSYDDKGKVEKMSLESTIKNKVLNNTFFKYNKKGWVTEEKVIIVENNKETITNYEYNDKGNVIKRSGNKRSTAIFTYDDKKNPMYDIFPENYPNGSLGEGVIIEFSKNKNNIITKAFEGVDDKYKSVYTYIYEGNKPKKLETTYSNGKTYTETVYYNK